MVQKMKLPTIGALLAFFIVAPSIALATTSYTYHFNVVQNGPSDFVKTEIHDQLYVVISEVGGKAQFTFHNYDIINGTTYSMVATSIYFDNEPPPVGATGDLLVWVPTYITNYAGTNYSAGASPPDLPSGNDISFVASGAYDPRNPKPKWGINEELSDHISNPIEQLDIRFDYDTGNFDKVISALNSGALDIGMHVQAIGVYGGQSLSVHLGGNGTPGPGPGPTPIPEPATMLLFGTGLASIAGSVRRRKKLQK